MPIYDYRCTVCGKQMLDVFKSISASGPSCCGTSMQQIFSPPTLDNFKPQWFEHLATEPLFFERKKDLRKYCRDHNLSMDYVE